MTPHLEVWNDKYAVQRPRRLLAVDGGGILGILSLEILAEVERQLAEQTGKGDAFKLGDYFDYIGGTSTGAIIATGLAVGMSVAELVPTLTRCPSRSMAMTFVRGYVRFMRSR